MAEDRSLKQTAELARKNARKRRRAWITVSLVLAVGLALAAGYQFWLRDSSLVEIRDLQIQGVTAETDQGEEITATVKQAVGGMTTLHLDPGGLERDLARFPRVESADIEADFPNGATVTVGLRSDGSVLGTGEDAVLIATDGTVLGPAGEAGGRLPVIADGESADGGRLEGPELAQATVLGATPDEIRSFVERSEFGKNGVEVILSNGPVLVFGDDSSVDQKWRAAASVISDPELTDAGYVDLSLPRRPAVGTGKPVGEE
ncbi:MAG: FtsQ-type POTRA domain-containing protein [Thermoleophilia bacterium]|nr:FtsQ-type POTRA domain-containing protein [Thermoleophilia bacterium]